MAFFRRFAAGLVTGAMLLTTAGAAVSATVVKNTEITADATDKGLYKVTFTDSKLKSGNQYVLLVASYEGASTASGTVNVTIDESTLTFIDQAAATGTTVSFNVRPKSYPNSLVLLGGDFNGGVTGPIVIGYINATGTPMNFEIKVADENTASQDLSDVTFSVYDPDIPVDKLTDATSSGKPSKDGKLSITIPEGKVTIQLTRDGYVPMTILNVTGADISKFLENFCYCAGDIDGDKRVTLTDLDKILEQLKNKADKSADVDRDNRFTLNDLNLVLSNLGATVTKRTYNGG